MKLGHMPDALNRDLVLIGLVRALGAGLTRREAACSLHVYNLSACVQELRDQGCAIATTYQQHTDPYGRQRQEVVYHLEAVSLKALDDTQARTGLQVTP